MREEQTRADPEQTQSSLQRETTVVWLPYSATNRTRKNAPTIDETVGKGTIAVYEDADAEAKRMRMQITLPASAPATSVAMVDGEWSWVVD